MELSRISATESFPRTHTHTNAHTHTGAQSQAHTYAAVVGPFGNRNPPSLIALHTELEREV